MTGSHQCPGSRGFTLLEVLVAVAILGVALTALLALHAGNVRLTAESQDITIATMLASRLAAVAKAEAFPAVGSENGSFSDDDVVIQSEFDEEYGGPLSRDFLWQRDIESTGLDNLRLVRISVGRDLDQPLASFEFLVRRGGP